MATPTGAFGAKETGDASEGALCSLPPLDISFSDSWGPPSHVLFPSFDRLPFRLFSRTSKIGKVADFGGFLRFPMKGRFARTQGEQHSELDFRGDGGLDGDDADGAFQRVESKAPPRLGGGGGYTGGRGGRGGGRGGRGGMRAGDDRGDAGRGRGAQGQSGTSFNKRFNRLNRARWVSGDNWQRGGDGRGPGGRPMREFSVKIQSDWVQLETMDLAKLKEMSGDIPPAAKDLKWTGVLEAYDEDYDRVQARINPKKLRRFEDATFFYKTAQDDPVLGEYAGEGVGNVIATDAVLSHLMTCTRSIYPWDIVINYIHGVIILDVRDPLDFELHSVSETATMQPGEKDPDDINGRAQLEVEATAIFQNFSQQVLAVNNGKTPEPASAAEVVPDENPLWDPAAEAAAAVAEAGADGPPPAQPTPAAVAFRYRNWQLSRSLSLVARTTVHAVLRKKAGASAGGGGGGGGGGSTSAAGVPPQYLQVYTLNEWDPKCSGVPDWRNLIDTQRGSVLSTEIKNNNFKLARFTASALLAGVDSMRLGFVSRAARSDPDNHQVVGTQSTAPATFAHQLQLNVANMWGILRWLVELVRKHARNLQQEMGVTEDEYQAKFVLARDPVSQQVHLYNVPEDTFDREEETQEAAAGWLGGDGGDDGGGLGGL